jgi:hypothetical protein
MSNLNNTNEMLGVIGQVLIRCFVMGIFVLLFWLGALALGGDLAYSVHAKIVPISREQFYVIHYREQFYVIHYAGGLMTKAAVFFLFLFPYIAIRLVIRKRKR